MRGAGSVLGKRCFWIQPGGCAATAGQRACVGRFVGRYQMGSADDGTTVNVYDRVVWQKAQSPRAIDLYLDNVWQQRVHW